MAQTTFLYEYDAAGNQVKRTVKAAASKSDASVDVAEPEMDVAGLDMDLGNAWLEQGAAQGGLNRDADAFRALVYPNPTSGRLTVALPDLKDGDQGRLWVYGVTGEQVLQRSNVQREQSIDIGHCTPGVYVVNIVVDGKRVVRNVIKR